MNNLFPIFFHGNPIEGMAERFDTIMMPNGGVAVLNGIAATLGCPGVSIDEGYLGEDNTGSVVLTDQIELALAKSMQPIILASVLNYNAAKTIALLRQLKHEYGHKVRVGVGGQLIRVSPDSYRRRKWLDHVSVGDAEVTLPHLLAGERYAEGYIGRGMAYALPDYSHYFALPERLEAMSRYHMGPFTGVRQLVTESVRGCAWAYETQVCDMCSLDGVALQPRWYDLNKHFTHLNELRDRFGANWCFDVSNQWLPTTKPKDMAGWLTAYCTEQDHRCGKERLQKYIYLTANSITAETAPLLRQAGVRIVYIGFDGWDKRTLNALHKSRVSIQKVLALCRDHDLHVRTSLVIGNGVNERNTGELSSFVRETISEFGSIIRSWGNFIQIVLPGSPVFHRFQLLAMDHGWQEVTDLFARFSDQGYFTWEEQSRLNELYIRLTQSVDYDAVVAARDAAELAVNQSAFTTGVTIERGGEFK